MKTPPNGRGGRFTFFRADDARALLDRLQAQSVTYAEITLSAGVVLWKDQDLGAVYDAVWRESQRSGIQVRWILDAVRHFGADKALPVAQFAVSRREQGVVAFGIGGDEARGPAGWFRDIFAFARDGGRLAFAAWSDPFSNPWMLAPVMASIRPARARSVAVTR